MKSSASVFKLLMILSFILTVSIIVIHVSADQKEPGPPGDYGDAPQNMLSGYRSISPEPIATFPTVFFAPFDPSYIVHRLANQGVILGKSVTKELNANVVNNDDGDDGWAPGSFLICQKPQLELTVTIPNNVNSGPIYFNLLADWNHDGRWAKSSECQSRTAVTDAAEWTIRNLRLDQPPYNLSPGFSGTIQLPKIQTGPDVGEMWMRFTITTVPVSEDIFVPEERGGFGWNGQGDFDYGETEDYFSCALKDRSHLLFSCPANIIEEALPINHPPVGRDDNSQTVKNTNIVVQVLSNDFDPDGDKILVFDASIPNNGQVFINPNNTISYLPKMGFQGMDSFNYTVCDLKGLCSKATVLVTVK